MSNSIQGPASFYDRVGSYGPSTVSPTPPVDATASSTSAGEAPASTVRVSPWAQVLGKLQRLQEDAPATFKVAVGHMAHSVRESAEKADGDQKQELLKLSQKLHESAKSGDLGVFKPTHHHHSRHPAAAQASSTQALPSVLESLLDQIDHVLGPDASPGGSS